MDLFSDPKPRTSLALPPRTVLNNVYEIGRVLGKGGFGITYAALDQHLRVPVAIKEYLPAQVAGRGTDRSTVEPHGGNERDVFEHGLNAFLEEARTLAQFNHPNIVRVRAFFREYGTAYLVMPYYEGRTLDAVAAESTGPMVPETAMGLMDPVFDGLEAVHASNLLHRDIKPQNIYLTDDGGTILLDFGAARIAFGQESQSLSAVLTPGYAPFEQYSRRGHQGPWTDVYATAATLYRLVTGRKPPEATDRMAGEPLPPVYTLNPAVAPAFSDAVGTALALHPKDRPQSVAAFRALLEAPGGDPTVRRAPAGEDETILDPGQTVVGDAATLAHTPGPRGPGGAETVLDPATAPGPPGRTVLVLSAREPVRYRLDGGDIQTLQPGASREIDVTPGRHTVAAAFGRRRKDYDVSVPRGSRHTLALEPPPGGARPPARDRGGRSGTGRTLRWVLGGGGVLLLLLIVAALADGGGDPSTDAEIRRIAGSGLTGGPQNDGDEGPRAPATPGVVPIQFAGLGAPYEGAGAVGPGDETLDSGEYADVYQFETGQANLFFIEAYSEIVDPYLILLGPDGEKVAENDDFNGDATVSYIEYHVARPGPHRLIVTTFSEGEVGEYFLTVTPDFVP